MNICPCCKRAIPNAKPKQDRRLTQDFALAQSALTACRTAYLNPFYANIQEAIQQEEIRLISAFTDHRLLWSLYRRRDKGTPYYETQSAEQIAA